MTTSTERPDGGELNSEIVRLIDELRRDEGDSVTFISDNPDFNGQPNCAIVCNGDWTGYEDRRFAADTILDALSSAATERKLPTARQVIAESNGHHWVQRFNLVCCRDCGIVRRADDKNSPCKGIVTVELRTPTNESPAPHPPVEGLREWFNSFRGDHGKTEWDQLLSILVSPSLTAGPVGYISPETLAELTNNANGVGPVVASAAYSTVIPLYAAPATLTEQPSEAPPSAPDVREALEPFVAALDGCVDESARDDDHIWESPAAMNITVGNLRVLRAIYETLQPSEYREDRAIARVMASKTAALSQQPVAVADREAIAGEFEPVGTQYLHYSPFTGHEVWLDRDFYNGHRATVSREVFARKSALALLHPQPAKGERP